jgi:hypothetical protein
MLFPQIAGLYYMTVSVDDLIFLNHLFSISESLFSE